MTDRDDWSLERRLRKVLRPVDPPSGFAERVSAAAERARASAGANARVATKLRSRSAWLMRRAGLPSAATLALALALGGTAVLWHQHTRELQAHEAREQLLQALRISSQTLNAALRAMANPSRSG